VSTFSNGHYYSSTAEELLAISTPHATLGRIDSVVSELDPSGNTILLKVIAGTAASTPAAPTLTQTDAGVYQIRLANVAVAAAATTIAAGAVTDTRTFISDVSVAWALVTGKPTEFTPAAHTQNASTIITTSTDKSADYTLVAGDKNTYIRSTNAAITITVPDVLANGENVNFIQAGTGQITFAGSGITLNSVDAKVKTSKQFAGVTVVKSGGAYYLIGSLGA